MCYSAQIVADYRKYVKMFGAHMSIKEFAELYWEHGGRDLKAPLAMEAAFSDAQTDDERRIQALIAENNSVRATMLEQEVFEQRARLAKAECERRSKSDTKRRRSGIEPLNGLFWLSSLRGTRTAGYRGRFVRRKEPVGRVQTRKAR